MESVHDVLGIVDPKIFNNNKFDIKTGNIIVKLIKQIFKKHTHLQKYINSMSMSAKSYDRYDTRESTPAMMNLADLGKQLIKGELNYTELDYLRTNACVEFRDFGIAHLIEASKRSGKTLKDIIYPHHKSQTYARLRGYTTTCMNQNVDPDFRRLPPHFLNVISAHKIMIESRERSARGYFVEFILFGIHDTLIAYVSTDGILVIRWSIIKYLITKCSPFAAKSALEKILLRYNEVHSFITGENPDYMGQMLTKLALEKWGMDSVASTLKAMDDHIHCSLYSDRTDILFYKPLVEELAKYARNELVNVKKEAMAQGMAVSAKLNLLGWDISDYGKAGSKFVWWEKKIEIIPKIFVLDEMHYILPDKCKSNTYKITMLYLNSECKLYCKGSHPNVSGGKVCMGNLKPIDLIDADFETIKEFLIQATSLLQLMNYDSPHDMSKRKAFIAVAKPMQIGEKGQEDDEVVKSITSDDCTVRSISFTVQPTTETVVVEEHEADISSANTSESVPLNPAVVNLLDDEVTNVPSSIVELGFLYLERISEILKDSSANTLHDDFVNDYVWLINDSETDIRFGQMNDSWGDPVYFIYKNADTLPYTTSLDRVEDLLQFWLKMKSRLYIEYGAKYKDKYMNSSIRRILNQGAD